MKTTSQKPVPPDCLLALAVAQARVIGYLQLKTTLYLYRKKASNHKKKKLIRVSA